MKDILWDDSFTLTTGAVAWAFFLGFMIGQLLLAFFGG
jgi:hypothetical protein